MLYPRRREDTPDEQDFNKEEARLSEEKKQSRKKSKGRQDVPDDDDDDDIFISDSGSDDDGDGRPSASASKRAPQPGDPDYSPPDSDMEDDVPSTDGAGPSTAPLRPVTFTPQPQAAPYPAAEYQMFQPGTLPSNYGQRPDPEAHRDPSLQAVRIPLHELGLFPG